MILEGIMKRDIPAGHYLAQRAQESMYPPPPGNSGCAAYRPCYDATRATNKP